MDPIYPVYSTPQGSGSPGPSSIAQSVLTLPEFKLPSYQEFGRSAGNVMVREGEKSVVRKPTIEEQIGIAADQNKTDRQLTPILEYSAAQSEPFRNPALPYDPTLDMTQVYAQYDPVTWGDAVRKLNTTYYNNLMSSTKNLYHGLTEGITQGRIDALWNNSYSKELAEITDNYEKLNPMFFQEGEQGDISTWVKQVLPAFGYAGAAITEGFVQHAVLTGAGAAIGAVAGDGVGAIPGALAGTVAAGLKDLQTVGTTLRNMSAAARAINTLSTGQKIVKGAQLLGSGLLMANGEAALNAQMAAKSTLDIAERDYFNTHGRYMNDQERQAAKERADAAGQTTFNINMPLIAASNILQFSNLLRGKALPSAMEGLAFAIDPKTGMAVAKSAILKVGTNYVKEVAAEAFEEFAQGVVESAVNQHFGKNNGRAFMTDLLDATYNRATSGEGLGEAAAGAFVGAITNAPTLAGFATVGKNSKAAVQDYNSMTRGYMQLLGDSIRQAEELGNYSATVDAAEISKATHRNTVNLVNNLAKRGMTDSFQDTIDAMTEMDAGEFNRTFGTNLRQEQISQAVSAMKSDFAEARAIRESVDNVYRVNPYIGEGWVKKLLNKVSADGVDQGLAKEAWEMMKDHLTSLIYTKNSTERDMGILETEYARIAGPMFGMSASQVVRNVAKEAALYKDADLSTALSQFYRYTISPILAENLSDEQKYLKLREAYEQAIPGSRTIIATYNRYRSATSEYNNILSGMTTPAMQRKTLKTLMDYLILERKQIAAGTSTSEAATTPAPADTSSVQPAQPAQEPIQTPAPTAATTVAPTTAPTTPATTSDEMADEFTIAPFEVQGTTPGYADNFGEGNAQDTDFGDDQDQPAPVNTPAPPRPAAPTAPTAPIVDNDMPDGLQVDEAELADRIQKGNLRNPADAGVDMEIDGRQVTGVTRDGNSVIYNTQEGTEERPIDDPLRGVDVFPSVPMPAGFTEGSSPEDIAFLESLLKHNYAAFVCE